MIAGAGLRIGAGEVDDHDREDDHTNHEYRPATHEDGPRWPPGPDSSSGRHRHLRTEAESVTPDRTQLVHLRLDDSAMGGAIHERIIRVWPRELPLFPTKG